MAVIGVATKSGDGQLTIAPCNNTSNVDQGDWSKTALKAWEAETANAAIFVSVEDMELQSFNVQPPSIAQPKGPKTENLEDASTAISNAELQNLAGEAVEAIAGAIGGLF
jgi:hypothetical protein